jgi:hypothetical protein
MEEPQSSKQDYGWVWWVLGAILFYWIVQNPGILNDQTSESSYTEINGTSECTSDCSGHDTGYDYARDHDITDSSYDNGNSESFNEGVREYAEDQGE